MGRALRSADDTGLQIEETTCPKQILLRSNERRFRSVPADEMGFALSLFVMAANGQISARPTDSEESRHSLRNGRTFLCALTRELDLSPPPAEPRPDIHENTLDSAFLTLWQHYQGDQRQGAICARVLSFYHLMLCSKGAAVQAWTTECPDSPEAVALHPAVTHALALVPLTSKGLLPDGVFQAMISSIASNGSWA